MNILGKDRNELIMQLAESKNGVEIDRSAVAITAIINAPSTANYDASVELISINPAVYTGKQKLKYDKISLNKELAALKPNLEMFTYSTTHDLLPQLEEKYGLVVTVDDIILSNVNSVVTPWEIYFKAKATSPVFKTTGNGLKVTVKDSSTHLATVLKRLNLTGLNMPSSDVARIQGPLLTYPAFSTSDAVLRSYLVGYTISAPTDNDWVLADTLTAITEESWDFKQTGYTLYGATVVYNGTTTVASANGYHVNTARTNVLILSCGLSGVVGGYIVVHY